MVTINQNTHALSAVNAVAVALLLVAGVSAPSSGYCDEDSLARIQTRGILEVGTDIPYGVMEFLDDAGKPIGIDMDIGREIAESLGVRMEVRSMAFDDLFDALRSGRVDVLISAVTITPERQKTMLFSVPYLDTGLSLAVRSDRDDIRGPQDLAGKRVGVLKGTTGESYMESAGAAAKALLVRYESNEKRLADLESGVIDAAIVHFLVESRLNIKTVGEPLDQAFYGIVARSGDHDLMRAVNRTLRTMKRSGKLSDIKRRYSP